MTVTPQSENRSEEMRIRDTKLKRGVERKKKKLTKKTKIGHSTFILLNALILHFPQKCHIFLNLERRIGWLFLGITNVSGCLQFCS